MGPGGGRLSRVWGRSAEPCNPRVPFDTLPCRKPVGTPSFRRHAAMAHTTFTVTLPPEEGGGDEGTSSAGRGGDEGGGAGGGSGEGGGQRAAPPRRRRRRRGGRSGRAAPGTEPQVASNQVPGKEASSLSAKSASRPEPYPTVAVCTLCGGPHHWKRCEVCHLCHQPGHYKRDCPKNEHDGDAVCGSCGGKGHISERW